MLTGARARLVWVLGGTVAGLLALGSGLWAAGVFPAAQGRSSPNHAATAGRGQQTGQPSGQAPAAQAQEEWWKPLPAARGAFVPAQLVIEKLHVQAPIEVKGVDAHDQMQAPDRPTDAAWYTFTAKPGSGSNAVFSGHRDFAKVGPAIFWHLNQLVAGDVIDVVSGQNTQISYRVTQTWSYAVSTIPMAQVLATDRQDEVTLITCSGTYTPATGYSQRLVVRAVRVA